ncbi:hypothetical protein REPUB_Repub11eG0130300 [Reevesia pubescens]
MSLAPAPQPDGPLFAEVDMGAERLLRAWVSAGAVLFPEAFIGGYPRGSNFGITIGNRTAKGKEEFRKYHASAIDVPGPEVERLAAMAGEYKVGSCESTERSCPRDWSALMLAGIEIYCAPTADSRGVASINDPYRSRGVSLYHHLGAILPGPNYDGEALISADVGACLSNLSACAGLLFLIGSVLYII